MKINVLQVLQSLDWLLELRIKGASKLPREFWQRMRMLQVPIHSAFPDLPARREGQLYPKFWYASLQIVFFWKSVDGDVLSC